MGPSLCFCFLLCCALYLVIEKDLGGVFEFHVGITLSFSVNPALKGWASLMLIMTLIFNSIIIQEAVHKRHVHHFYIFKFLLAYSHCTRMLQWSAASSPRLNTGVGPGLVGSMG